MKVHLIQPRAFFGPPERHFELAKAWARNETAGFDRITPIYEGRPTFSDMFAVCEPRMVNVIANSDIYLDPESVDVLRSMSMGDCYALSRWDVGQDGNATPYHLRDSQDVWAFCGRPMFAADFALGVPGCDNRIARLFLDNGYRVSNPCNAVKCYHLHNVAWRSYLVAPDGRARGGDKIERVPGPYHLVDPIR